MRTRLRSFHGVSLHLQKKNKKHKNVKIYIKYIWILIFIEKKLEVFDKYVQNKLQK